MLGNLVNYRLPIWKNQLRGERDFYVIFVVSLLIVMCASLLLVTRGVSRDRSVKAADSRYGETQGAPVKMEKQDFPKARSSRVARGERTDSSPNTSMLEALDSQTKNGDSALGRMISGPGISGEIDQELVKVRRNGE